MDVYAVDETGRPVVVESDDWRDERAGHGEPWDVNERREIVDLWHEVHRWEFDEAREVPHGEEAPQGR